ncbi:MAG: signal peptidase II [Gemmatimonadetes bacterium]|nr:signal peptidase II [Gemmatimonadota bacterium]
MTTPLPLSDYAHRRGAPELRHGRRSTDRLPNTGWIPVIGSVLLIAFADWATKLLVRGWVPLDGFVPVLFGRLAFWHVENPAMILGLHGDLPLLSRQVITILAALLAPVILVDIVKRAHRLPLKRQRAVWLCAGLAFGGMLGNFGERLLHWRVTDFLSLRVGDVWLPPTNLADLAVLASLPLSAVVIRYELDARRQRRSARVRELPLRRPNFRVD